MSQENVKAFFDKIEGDEDLGDRYRSLLKGMAESSADEESAMAKVVDFASENGHEFSSEDLKLAAENMKDGTLSDEELDAVAGGALGWVILGAANCATDGDKHICFVAGLSIEC